MANGTTYRRGSVFGALALIGIGGLFLYANVNPGFSPWPFAARYWPVLIILWGLGKLFDYLALRGRPEAAAASRITGGDIVGLVFLILLGWCFTQVVQHGWWRGGVIRIGDEEVGCLLGNEYDFSDEFRQAIPEASTVRLSNLRGNLSVTAVEGEEIQVATRKVICSGSESEAQEMAERFEPALTSTAEGYEFHWDTSSGARGLVTTEVEVQVPASVNLEVSTRRGDVRVSGARGKVTVRVERGEAAVENIDGDVQIEIRRGNVRIANVTGSVEVEGRGDEAQIRNTAGGASLEGRFYGPIRFANIAGEARFVSRRTTFKAARIEGEMSIDSGVLVLRGVPGAVTLLTRDKEIEVEEVSGQLRIENRNGRVVIHAARPPAEPIEVENRSGSIELYLPAESGFEISATARDGEIESDFRSESLELERESGGDQVLRGTHGRGRTPIRLTTRYGTIYLRRSG
ncbi:MAG: DUF4097 family beta strand repeat-containing protein [Terriglobia bacterium]